MIHNFSGIAAKQRISVILLAPAFPQGTQQTEEKNLPICLSYLAFTENDYRTYAKQRVCVISRVTK
jgi:hypothetical protein